MLSVVKQILKDQYFSARFDINFQQEMIIPILRKYYILLISMNKEFVNKIAKKPCDVEDLYGHFKEETKKYSNYIGKVQHKESTYFTSYGTMPSTFSDKRCTLVLFQKGGLIMLGYCLQTKGFPFVQQVAPQMKDNISIDSIKFLKISEKYMKIEAQDKIKNKDTNYEWQFDFYRKQLKQDWFFLIVYLWYCRKKKIEFNIDLIFKEMSISKYEKIQKKQTEKYFNRKPASLEEPIESITNTHFIKLKSELEYLKNKEKQYLSKIDQLQKQLNQLSSNQTYQQQIKSNQQAKITQYDKLKIQQLQIEALRKTLESKEQEIRNRTQDFTNQKVIMQASFQLQNQNLRKRIQDLNHLLDQEKTKNNNIAQKGAKHLSEKNNVLQKLQALTRELNQEKQKQQQKLKNNKQINQTKNNEIKQLKSKLQQVIKRYQEMEQNLKKESEISRKFKEEGEQKDLLFYQLKEKYNQILWQYDSYKQLFDSEKCRLMDQINQMKDLNQNNRNKNQISKKQLQQDLNNANNQTLRLKDQQKRLTNQIERLVEQIQKAAVWMKEMQIVKIKLEKNSKSNLLHIFEGNVLEDKQQYKEFMKEQIEIYRNKKILKTKKIYTLEQQNKTDFHKYVDQIPEIAVIVKTEAGFYLAGYSQSPISSKTSANKGGLILSLNNLKSFSIIPGKRSVTYDTFFFIIGNSEIRLKNQEWKMFSNFGIANSFFKSNGCGVSELLGEAVRQVKIVTFEVHQIVYE